MAKKKNKDESTSQVEELSDSKETIHDEIADFSKEQMLALQECIENERKINEEQIKRVIEKEKEECIINSFLVIKNEKRTRIVVNNSTIEDDIEIITGSL
ncbi:hypothetical protein BDAP_002163 [Binucleata daphniae]